jgi:AcrR family transcriptional regulator
MKLNVVNQPEGNKRQRILEAAGEVFAKQGFRATTVRAICKLAEANLAAVNYYYRDKEHLYLAVLKYSFKAAMKKYPPDLGLEPGASAEERLQAFILSLLLRILYEGHPAWHGKLMAREMIEPTPALEVMIEEAFRPLFEQLAAILKNILGDDINPEKLKLYQASIIGQCLFYYHARPVISRMMPEPKYSREDIGRLAEHITNFSLAALKRG